MRRHPFYQHPMMRMLNWSPLSNFGGMSPYGGMFDQLLDPFEHLNRIMGGGRNLGGRNLGGRQQWIGSQQQQQQRPRSQQRRQQRPQRQLSPQRSQQQWPQQQRKLSQKRFPQRSLSQQRGSGPQLSAWSPKQQQKQQIKQKRPTMIQQHSQQQQLQQKQQRQSSVTCCKMPQKYRISIDCSKLRVKSIKTDVRDVKGKQMLVICAQTKENRDFRRQFALPKNCNRDKLITCCKPGSIFVVEFPLLEVPVISNIKLSPQIVRRGREQVVTLNLTIPHTVDLTKVQVCAKERDLIVRLEDKSSICSGSECANKVLFYNRIVLPVNTDHALLKCVQKKRKLIITAPLLSKTMGGFRCVPIHRKLRHRKIRKVTATSKRIGSSVKSSQQKLQKKKQTVTPLKKVPSGVSGIKKEKSATQLKQTEQKKQKNSSTVSSTDVTTGGNIKSVGSASKLKQPVLTPTPLAKSKKPASSSKSKLSSSSSGGRNIAVERVTSPTSPSGKRKSPVSKGSEVLQQIFGSSSTGGKSEELISGRKSSLEL
jgi:hypothetical protein